MDSDQGIVLGLLFHLDQAAMREFLEDAFERGHGDVGQAGEVFIADRTAVFLFGMR